ncbi:MAG: ABC transporter ATP-binding protein [Victivallales bacterium]|nr:ABC transporter ATP-binding protein [Victivallales bacterium]
MSAKLRDAVGDTFISMSGVDLTISDRTVLDHVDLDVAQGELLALVGGNGAGKSTVLRCLAGLWRPKTGTIEIGGLDRFDDDLEIRRFTAYLPPNPEFDYSNSIRENVAFFAEAYGLPEKLSRDRMDSLLRMFGLKDAQDKAMVALSKGERKKTALACALISGARLYLLDEPFTDGIDPRGYAALKEVLEKLAANREITVVFATQILEMAVELADRIAVVNYGRILAVGTPDELRLAADLPKTASFAEVFAKLASKETEKPANDYLESL